MQQKHSLVKSIKYIFMAKKYFNYVNSKYSAHINVCMALYIIQIFSVKEKKKHIIQFQDNFRAFVSKLQNHRRRKVNLGSITMFKKLCGGVDKS